MIVVAVPNPAVDKLLVVPRLQRGNIHRPTRQISVPGGKGLNVARVAHALGADVRVVGITAGAAGKWIADAVESNEISAVWLQTDGESRTCTSVADASGDDLTEFYETGPRVSAEVWRCYVRRISVAVTSADWLVISGSLPQGISPEQFLDLLDAHSGDIAVDTSGIALRTAVNHHVPALVKVNVAETLELLDASPDGADARQLPELARELFDRTGGRTTVVVTGGREGAVMASPDGSVLWGRLGVFGRYPVGSGDAFLAGLLASRQAGDSWRRSLQVAVAAATANAEVAGAGVIDAGRVAALSLLVEVNEMKGSHG